MFGEALSFHPRATPMSRPLLDLVLPRLAQRLNRHLRRFQSGQLSENQFSRRFEVLLAQQHAWLSNRGVHEVRAAEAIHGAVLVLSAPGLKVESQEQKRPLELIEFQAVRSAANDIARTYGVDPLRTTERLSRLVAEYAE
jgi:hypothetical protein